MLVKFRLKYILSSLSNAKKSTDRTDFIAWLWTVSGIFDLVYRKRWPLLYLDYYYYYYYYYYYFCEIIKYNIYTPEADTVIAVSKKRKVQEKRPEYRILQDNRMLSSSC